MDNQKMSTDKSYNNLFLQFLLNIPVSILTSSSEDYAEEDKDEDKSQRLKSPLVCSLSLKDK